MPISSKICELVVTFLDHGSWAPNVVRQVICVLDRIRAYFYFSIDASVRVQWIYGIVIQMFIVSSECCVLGGLTSGGYKC